MATTTTTSSADVRITPKLLDAMRRRHREQPAETHPERRLRSLLSTMAAMDPKDRLGLSGPGDTDRLNHVMNQIER